MCQAPLLKDLKYLSGQKRDHCSGELFGEVGVGEGGREQTISHEYNYITF